MGDLWLAGKTVLLETGEVIRISEGDLIRMCELLLHEKQELQKKMKSSICESPIKMTKREIVRKQMSEIHIQAVEDLDNDKLLEVPEGHILEERLKDMEENVAALEALNDVNNQLIIEQEEFMISLKEEVECAKKAKQKMLEELNYNKRIIVLCNNLVSKLKRRCFELEIAVQEDNDVLKYRVSTEEIRNI